VESCLVDRYRIVVLYYYHIGLPRGSLGRRFLDKKRPELATRTTGESCAYCAKGLARSRVCVPCFRAQTVAFACRIAPPTGF